MTVHHHMFPVRLTKVNLFNRWVPLLQSAGRKTLTSPNTWLLLTSDPLTSRLEVESYLGAEV